MSQTQQASLLLGAILVASWPLTRLTLRVLDRRDERREQRQMRRAAARATGDHDRLDGAP